MMTMLSAIRRRLTYTNVAVTLALVFAMSGGAYAASRYVITSTKQISPKVLKSLQGKAGQAGAAGPAGVQGSQGSQGVRGETGPQGSQGKEGPPGKNGENGKPGTTGFTETLPPGETETGSWSGSLQAEGENILVPISFNIPLPAPIKSEDGDEHVFRVGATGNGSTCPGTAAEPKAAEGDLCIYEAIALNVTLSNPKVASGLPEAGAATAGAYLQLTGAGAAPRFAWGTWAVTAE